MTLVSQFSHCMLTILMTLRMDLPSSYRRCDILWNHDLRKVAMGEMPDSRKGRSLRHCVHRRTFRK
jgi:hypothetical protein